MVRGMPHIDQLFPEQARHRATGALDLVHGDICGPIAPTTPSGNRYFLLVDDMSRYMWLCPLASKDQAPGVIKRFKTVGANSPRWNSPQ